MSSRRIMIGFATMALAVTFSSCEKDELLNSTLDTKNGDDMATYFCPDQDGYVGEACTFERAGYLVNGKINVKCDCAVPKRRENREDNSETSWMPNG